MTEHTQEPVGPFVGSGPPGPVDLVPAVPNQTRTEAAELLRLLPQITPGVWKVWGMTVMADQDGTGNVDTAVEVARTAMRDEHGKPRTFDADFIAEAQRTIPSLLASLVAAEALAEQRDQRYVDVRQQRDDAEAERDEARARMAELETVNASLNRQLDTPPWTSLDAERARVAAVEAQLAKARRWIENCVDPVAVTVKVKQSMLDEIDAALAAASPPEEPTNV